jgi:branched-chain amino acid transport system permease protein
MHGPFVHTKAFWRVLRAYATALVPAVFMGIGAVILIEMSYRVSTQPELGTRMRIVWIMVDAASPWPWIAAMALFAGGLLVFRKTWPIVAAAWSRATDEAGAVNTAARRR